MDGWRMADGWMDGWMCECWWLTLQVQMFFILNDEKKQTDMEMQDDGNEPSLAGQISRPSGEMSRTELQYGAMKRESLVVQC